MVTCQKGFCLRRAAVNRCTPDGAAAPRTTNPLPLVAGKRTASPHITSGWKDDPSEANRTK
jgi:hypothetical protein